MALYAIGDLHLAFQVDKSMEIFGPIWKNHAEQVEAHWKETVREEDTVVLTGDHSWGRTLAECQKDLEFVMRLPGRKILLRGNHDRFWDANKTRKLNDLFAGELCFLQNNCFSYGEYAIVGTKGYVDEGRDSKEQVEKMLHREEARLQQSFQCARKEGFRKYIMCLHYPPTGIGERESCFTRLAKEYGVRCIVYSHLHGEEHFHESLTGEVDGIFYHLVSSDAVKFYPTKIMD